MISVVCSKEFLHVLPISDRIAQAGVHVVALRVEPGRLDEVFRTLTHL